MADQPSVVTLPPGYELRTNAAGEPYLARTGDAAAAAASDAVGADADAKGA